jgi:hypothetical protein
MFCYQYKNFDISRLYFEVVINIKMKSSVMWRRVAKCLGNKGLEEPALSFYVVSIYIYIYIYI